MIKLTREIVAAKQLQSAIWMYAYDYDEVAVHTIAGAAFELYIEKLGFGNFKKGMESVIRPGKKREFWKLFKTPYNYFKHGGYNSKGLDYQPETVDYMLFAASEANQSGNSKYKLDAAEKFILYFHLNHSDSLYPGIYKTSIELGQRKAHEAGIKVNDKELLRLMLDKLPSPMKTK